MRKILFLLFFFSCAQLTQKNTQELILDNPPTIGKTKLTGKLYLGGFSGIDFLKAEDDSIIVYTVTDRGPNTPSFDFNKDGIADRGFVLPYYTPEIVKLKLTGLKIEVLKRIPIKLKNKKISGLPNQNKKTSPLSFDETAFNIKKKKLKFRRSGIDPEGIALDKEDNFWVVEEYGPSILKISKKGKILKRFIPNIEKSKRYGSKKLPFVFGQRKRNRGFEGVVLLGNKLYTALQSPLPIGDWENNGIGHILEFDIEKEEVTGHYLYFFEKQGQKVGALTKTKDGKLLILEQNGKLGTNSFKKVFKLDISSATNIFPNEFNPKASRFEIKKMGYQPIPKTLYMNLDTNPKLTQHEKVEGMVLLPTKEIIITIDNDFGLGDFLDEETGEFNNVEVQKESHIYRIKL